MVSLERSQKSPGHVFAHCWRTHCLVYQHEKLPQCRVPSKTRVGHEVVFELRRKQHYALGVPTSSRYRLHLTLVDGIRLQNGCRISFSTQKINCLRTVVLIMEIILVSPILTITGGCIAVFPAHRGQQSVQGRLGQREGVAHDTPHAPIR